MSNQLDRKETSMAVRGGYQIVDLEGVNHSFSTPVKHEGIYEVIEGNFYKPCLLSGIVIDGVEYSDTYVTFFINASMYNAILPFTKNGNKITISINDEDQVIFSND